MRARALLCGGPCLDLGTMRRFCVRWWGQAGADNRLARSGSALRPLICLVGGGLFALTLTGCIARFDPDTMQPRAEVSAPPVYGAHTVGQTFVTARPGLCAIEVEWQSPAAITGPVVLHLRSEPTSTTDIVGAKVVADHQPVTRWRFPPIPDSQNRQFYLLVEAPWATPERPLYLYATAHDVYVPGVAYADNLPLPGDLVFRAFYNYDFPMFLQDLAKGIGDIWLLAPTVALFWDPGFLLLKCWPAAHHRFDEWERLALSMGLSLAIVPFLLLWVTRMGGALNAAVARVLFGGLGVIAIMVAGRHLWRRRAHRPRLSTTGRRAIVRAVLMVLVLGAGLVARLLAVRDLALPAWVDSVHHTMLARIIAESGRVPTSYEPYIAVQSATYHYGFQASVASFSWLSGRSVPEAMLLVGQVLNLAISLQTYLLARWLTRRWWSAFFAALIVALPSSMPAYYVSWGRYTQLSGLFILPVASVLSIEAVKGRDRRAAILGILAVAGLVLTHYRVLASYVCFIAAWWLVKVARRPRAWRSRLRELGWFGVLGLLALALLVPWILGVAADLWLPSIHWTARRDFSWFYVISGLDRYMLMLGLLGAAVALAGRRRFSIILLLWMGALFVITNPSLLGLPGEGLIDNVGMLIMWFMPLAIWCGFLGNELLSSWLTALRGRWRTLCYVLTGIGLVALSVYGVWRQITIVNPDCVLALHDDQEALTWIEEHTPRGSRLLVNGQLWQGSTYVGTDGGYWIVPLTQRSTTTPPALYSLGESGDVLHVKELNQQVESLATDPSRLWSLLREEGVDYVYVGALGGPLFLEALRSDPGFRLVYANTRIHIFEVEQ